MSCGLSNNQSNSVVSSDCADADDDKLGNDVENLHGLEGELVHQHGDFDVLPAALSDADTEATGADSDGDPAASESSLSLP